MQEFTIILFYKYVEIENPEALRQAQHDLARKLNLKGRVIVAKEGINATLEGTTENIEKYLKEFLADERFSNTHIKKSAGTGNAFPKLKVKIRPEIVSLGLENDIDPNQTTGKHIKPEDLKKWYESGEDFQVVDMRNDYEYNVGRFKNSVMPRLTNFRDIPRVLDELSGLKNKKVVTVCTGGVRCEKASGLLVREGFKDVYQLDGGIVTYMEKFPAQEFEGKLYVFDNRITMDFDSVNNLGGNHVVVGKCDKCSVPSERYVNCRNPECNKHFICCEKCSESDGKSYCSFSCKIKYYFKQISSNQTFWKTPEAF
jgi:UPF0176 protein